MFKLHFQWTLLFVASTASAQVFKLGDCPNVPAMAPFELDKFEGAWYVISKYETVSKCIRENVTRVGDEIFINAELDAVGVPMVQPATVRFYKNRPESMMRLQFPKNYQLSDVNYWVLDTDYKNYALVWSCVNSLIGHRESAQIMSRKPKLGRDFMDIVRAKVTNLNIDNKFTKVAQTGCRNWDEYGNAIIQFNKRHQAVVHRRKFRK